MKVVTSVNSKLQEDADFFCRIKVGKKTPDSLGTLLSDSINRAFFSLYIFRPNRDNMDPQKIIPETVKETFAREK